MPRSPSRVDQHTPTQPELPFLTPERAAVVDAARDAIYRAEASALAHRRTAEAHELHRIGDQLLDLLEANAAAVRGDR